MTSHLSDEQLSAHVDGALPGPDQHAADSHLGTCADCRRRLELLAATRRAVAGLPAEAPPRPLDLGFLAAPGALPLDAARRRWRPPAWVAPVLAAAAVLLVAVSLAPGMLGRSAGGASQASRGLDQSSAQLAPESRAGTGAPGAGSSADLPAGGAADTTTRGAYGFAAPAPASGLGQPSNHGAADGSGIHVDLTASAASAPPGQPLTVTLGARASTTVTVASYRVLARRGQDARVLATVSGRTMNAGNQDGISISWAAGQVSGSAQPGDCQLEGDVTLASGQVVSVVITIRVT